MGALINGFRRSRSLLINGSILNSISTSNSTTTTTSLLCRHNSSLQTTQAPSSSSPFESKIRRILRNEIQYHHDYAPPHQPVVQFDRFIVEDRPGEQWITLRGKSAADDEHIKIEATMFDDGSILAPKSEEEDVPDVRLHISMIVDIWKGEETDHLMEFVCSAWPDSFEIHRLAIFDNDSPSHRYMGPPIQNLRPELQAEFYKFLNTRGVNDGLSKFLHKYMINKDRIELIQWLRKVQSFFGN